MSLNSTFDSIDSFPASPAMSQNNSQQIFVSNSNVRNQHLTHSQMRGVKQIFCHYFPSNTGKRMDKNEKNKRWNSYKNRIYREYGRIITGKFASEKALIKRYSDPISFIKYKLKRSVNLNVSDLSQADQDYFHEIGGIDDINQLILRTHNLDSVQKTSNNYQSYLHGNRKRRRLNNTKNGQNTNTNTNSNNRQNNDNDDDGVVQVPPTVIIPIDGTTNIIPHPKNESGATEGVKLLPALSFLQDKLDIFEQEQLEKKKIEIFEITKQKVLALAQSIETQFNQFPHMIGCIPGITGTDQEKLAFNCWLNKYKNIIKQDRIFKDGYISLEIFMKQIAVLQTDVLAWYTFFTKWRLNRILCDDKFETVWMKMKSDLNLNVSQHVNNDKEEAYIEFDDEEKMDILLD